MSSRIWITSAFFLVVVSFVLNTYTVEARYLPTRSNFDRIDKLRELLKELLENEIEKEELNSEVKWRPNSDNRVVFKRAVTSNK